MILYKSAKAIVRSLGGDTDFLDIVAGDILGLNMLIYLDNVLPTLIDLIKENVFTLNKQEVYDIPTKVWQIQITQMISRFS